MSSSEENPLRERELVNALLRRRIAGLLIVPAAASHAYLQPEIQRGTPVIFLDRPPANLNVDTILIDNRGGAYKGIEHLLAYGHRRIGLICGDPAVHTGANRVAGYRAALQDRNIESDEAFMKFGCDAADKAEAAVRELMALEQPPTAIFATSNRISIAVLRALSSYMKQLAFVGFDDFEMADMLPLPVTVIAHDPMDMGRRAAELLIARIQGDERAPQQVLIPTELIIRGSGELPPL